MNRSVLAGVVVIFLIAVLSCKEDPAEDSGWKKVSFTWINPYAWDIEMLSTNNMIASCTGGNVLYLTADIDDYTYDFMEGAPMIYQGEGSYKPADLYNAYSVGNNVWLAGNGCIFGSFDAGENWITMLDDRDYIILSVYFENDLHGWAAGKSHSFDRAIIFETVNGGANWDVLYVHPSGGDNSYSIYRDIYYGNGVLWVIGDGYSDATGNVRYILKSMDSGISWDNQDAALDKLNNSQIYCIQFADAFNGWIGGYNELIYTNDGGIAWSNKPLDEAGSVSDFIFLDKDTGWIGADNGVFYTIDGGLSWEKQDLPGFESNHAIYGIDFIDKKNGVAAGANGAIYITTTGGE